MLLVCLLFCLGLTAARAQSLDLVAEKDWYPYAAERHGSSVGLSVDLVRAAYAAIGVPIRFKSMPFARCMAMVERGEELGCFNSGQDLKHNQDNYLFHATPLLYNENSIFARMDHRETRLGPAALSGKRVGLTHGASYGNAIEADQSVQRVVALSNLASLRMLIAGRVDYVVLDPRVAAVLEQANPEELRGRFKRVGDAFQRMPLYVAFSRKHPDAELRARQLDQGLAALKATGDYQRILERWNVPPP